ncbi:hypothetical protein LINPERHAP1_LOCUS5845 [Linum perenne]
MMAKICAITKTLENHQIDPKRAKVTKSVGNRVVE